ncbi:MAG: ribonuclease P protein component [Fimbriimonas sp.]|nr:ribonuclease P protein component [Fimbriimonas sp.]
MKGPSKERFEAIFTLGKRVKGDYARLIASPGTGLIGFAVSKKVGSRPRRNKLKRRFREAVFDLREDLDRRFDFVLMVNVEAVEAPYERVRTEVRALFAKAVMRWAEDSESS